MIPFLGHEEVLKEENEKIQEILLKRMLKDEKENDLVYLLPYAMDWKNSTMRSSLVQGLKKRYDGLNNQEAVLCPFQQSIFYFFYFVFAEKLTDKIPVELYSLVECIESQGLAYLHYICIQTGKNIKIFEEEIIRRSKLGDKICKPYRKK